MHKPHSITVIRFNIELKHSYKITSKLEKFHGNDKIFTNFTADVNRPPILTASILVLTFPGFEHIIVKNDLSLRQSIWETSTDATETVVAIVNNYVKRRGKQFFSVVFQYVSISSQRWRSEQHTD